MGYDNEKEYVKRIIELAIRRIDIKTKCLLKSELKNPKEDNNSFLSIKPTENIKNISISVDNEAIFFTKAEPFNILLPKEFDLDKDEKEVIFVLKDQYIKVFLNNRYIEILDDSGILYIKIMKDSDDLNKIKAGEPAYFPRIETSLNYKGNGWEISATLYSDLENQPIRIFNKFYEELDPPIYEIRELTILFNDNVERIISLIDHTENLAYIMDGLIYKVNSYNIESEHIQMSKLNIITLDCKPNSELDNLAINIIDLLKSKSIILYLKDKNIIYNNILFNSELQIVETPNILSIIGNIEEISGIIYITNQSLCGIEDNNSNTDINSLNIHIDKLIEFKQVMDDILKLEYIDKLTCIYNYGNLYIMQDILYQLNLILDRLIKIKNNIENN